MTTAAVIQADAGWMPPMKIKALAPWFGAKRNLAPKIVEQLGPHSAYWEPFCGSMAVLLAKPECRMETVNDLHGDLINLAHVLQDSQLGPRLYRRLRRSWMDESLYGKCWEAIHMGEPNGIDLDRAFAYFVASWLGRNGTSGLGTTRVGRSFAVRFTKNGGHGATRYRSVIDSIPGWRRRMRGITILCRDGFKLVERIEDAGETVVYVDPPYLEKGADYVHDFKGEDHTRLADLLQRFNKTRVVVSYYDHPWLADLYPDWTKLTYNVSKAMAHQSKRGANDTRAIEVLLINGPAYGEDDPDQLMMFDEAPCK